MEEAAHFPAMFYGFMLMIPFFCLGQMHMEFVGITVSKASNYTISRMAMDGMDAGILEHGTNTW